MHNERLHGELTFSISITLDDVDATEGGIIEDLQRTFARAIAANERFLPRGVTAESLWLEYQDVYTKDDDDRYMDYKMATDPRV